MKFINILKAFLLVLLLTFTQSSNRRSLNKMKQSKFNSEFFLGFFGGFKGDEMAKKLLGYLTECGASKVSIQATLKKMNDDFKRISPSRVPRADQNTLLYTCDGVRNTLRSILAIVRNCKLTYEYFKTYFNIVWKKLMKSKQLGNDIATDDVMKTIYSDLYPTEKAYSDSFLKNNYTNLGKIFADLLRKIAPYKD